MIKLAPLRKFLKSRDGERGATAVEFALVAPVFLMFVLGIFDFGRIFWIKNIMQYSAEQTARYAMVNPSVSADDLKAYADGIAADMHSGIVYTVNTDTIDGIEYRSITTSYEYTFIMPLIGSNVTLTAKARTPVNEL